MATIIDQVQPILDQHYQEHKASIDRRNARIQKDIEESRLLAKECHDQADSLRESLWETLNAEQKELFDAYSILHTASYMRSYNVAEARQLFTYYLKKAKRLLSARSRK